MGEGFPELGGDAEGWALQPGASKGLPLTRPGYTRRYEELWRGLGASTIGIRPTILQTAIPAYADRALLRFMADVNKFYGAHCLTHGRAEPLLVHTLRFGQGGRQTGQAPGGEGQCLWRGRCDCAGCESV